MNSIIWKGVPSATINGLLISELPPISKPKMRVKETTIDGRDGSIIEELGYEPYDKPVVIGLHGNFDINKVIKYFTGEGEVVFSNEPDKVYTAKIVGQIDYTRILRYRQATILFRTQPFKHKLLEAYKPAPTEVLNGTALVINDLENAKLKTFSIYGKTVQNGTPTPENPVELVSVGESGSITVQNMTIATPNGLCGIPVSSGGNYTDTNGQQWICDEIDLARGVYVQRVERFLFAVADMNGSESYPGWRNAGIAKYYPDASNAIGRYGAVAMCNIDSNPSQNVHINTKTNTDVIMIPNPNGMTQSEWKTKCPDLVFDLIISMPTSVETALSAEELSAYAAMNINEQNTTVQNDVNANMKIEYFLPYEVFNEGMETSKPIMVLKGEGTVVVSVNGYEIFQYTFPDGENEVVIDSEKEDAYLGDVLKNRNMNGEFPVLLPGTNLIEWSGYVSSVEILPRSRWL